MDAYDVFKKLSMGATFTRKKTDKQPLKEPPEIKIEPTEDMEQSKLIKIKAGDHATIKLLNTEIKLEEPRGKKRKLSPKSEEHKKKLLKIEEVNHYRNVNKISVVGKRIPDPVRSFGEIQVKSDLLKNVKDCEYEEPTPVQKQAIPLMLERRNILACAPTGSGKTAAFLLPVIHELEGPEKQGFRGLILCPTRELAKQIHRECVKLSEGRNLKIHIISKIKKALTQYGPGSSQKFDILITTPNRLCFLLKQDPPAISLANVKWLVIDEADKLFESGNRGFWEQLDQILNSCSNPDRKIAMFSATYTPKVAKWSVRNMKDLVRVTIGHRNTATDLVDQELLFVGNEQGKLLAFRDLVREGLSPPVLVFVQSKDRAQQLFNELIYDGINVDAIHADRTQTQRDNTVKSFREGRIWVLICTELMARGIDFKGVNLVINYDFPCDAISYVHRIGRAGRAGRRGRAITFFTIEDQVNLRSIAHILKESGCEVPEYMLSLRKRNRAERKKLQKSAPKRDHIRTSLKKRYRKKTSGRKSTDVTKSKLEKPKGFKVKDKTNLKSKSSKTKTGTKRKSKPKTVSNSE